MHLLLATLVAVAGPPSSEPREPVDAAGRESTGVVWHDQATVAPGLQQRLANELASARGVDPSQVLDAPAVAAGRVAQTVARARVEQGVTWHDQLEQTVRAYRAGELEQAQAGLTTLLSQVRADPVVPGAATVAWRAHVLRGQLAWAQGDTQGLDAAVAAAVALDPGATLSTRQVPPPVAEAYERQRAAIEADRARWPTLEISSPRQGPWAVEIDGVPGWRSVPPGEHLVVVRRPGRVPVGAVVDPSVPWSIPEAPAVLEAGLPRTREAAQQVCEHAALGWLLLVRVRDGRLGLQRYTCGEGFGPPWYQQRDGVPPGLGQMLEVPEQGWSAEPVLHREDPWPRLEPAPNAAPAVVMMLPDGSARTPRARLRRAWPWLLIGGVVAGAVVVGVVVGTDPGANLAVDGNSFLRP
ncbi:MAG: hypothetical protein AAGF11_39685 [Myxococcota bacterium]